VIKQYEHTQVGYFITIAIVAAMVAIGIIVVNTGVNWVATTVLGVLAVIAVLFHRLTVVINEEELVSSR
jgi:CDP-diglyceride synthetase